MGPQLFSPTLASFYTTHGIDRLGDASSDIRSTVMTKPLSDQLVFVIDVDGTKDSKGYHFTVKDARPEWHSHFTKDPQMRHARGTVHIYIIDDGLPPGVRTFQTEGRIDNIDNKDIELPQDWLGYVKRVTGPEGEAEFRARLRATLEAQKAHLGVV
jgi:hypothetical protein